MKRVVVGIVMSFCICNVFAEVDVYQEEWSKMTLEVKDALLSIEGQLSSDIDVFARLYKELEGLSSLVQEREQAEADFVKNLEVRLRIALEGYDYYLQEQMNVQRQGAHDVQELKVILLATQSRLQQEIDDLKNEYADAHIKLQQLVANYNQFVKDGAGKVDDFLNVLRTLCRCYTEMIHHKQVAFNEVNELLACLDLHIKNAGARFIHIASL